MNPISRRQLLAASLASLLPTFATVARAQVSDYPNRPIMLTHGFSAGGNADVVARLIGQRLETLLRQPVVIDIKSGAGGTIATNFVAKAKPDGYNLVMLTGAHTVSAAMSKSQPYDPIKDFAFISTVSSLIFVVAVRAEHPAKTLSELLAIAKKEPGKVTFTSVGVGSTQHMVGELLGSSAGVQLLHVPYRGGGAPVQAVIAGDVDILIDTMTVAGTHLKSSRIRALGISGAQTSPRLPDVPPVASILPGFEVRSWLGLAAPAGTPEAIVQKLNAATLHVLQQPEVRQALDNLGSDAAPSSPAEMHRRVEQEIVGWRQVVEKAGITRQ